METGVVLWYSVERGYGFILPDSALGTNDRSFNVYFAATSIRSNDLKPGDRVRFRRQAAKRSRALSVEVTR